jgi:hypothetical protein
MRPPRAQTAGDAAIVAAAAATDHPPGPLGTDPDWRRHERAYAFVAALLVVAFVEECVRLTWHAPASPAWSTALAAAAAGVFVLYAAAMWLGTSPATPTGFQAGAGTFLEPRVQGTNKTERALRLVDNRLFPWGLRSAFFRLPLIVPLVAGAVTFAAIPHRVSGDAYGQVLPTLVAVLGFVIALNGFLAARGQRTIDYIGALAAVLALIGGTVVSFGQVADGTQHHVQWACAALVYGLVAILVTLIRGTNAPDCTDQPGRAGAAPRQELSDRQRSTP